MSAQAAASAPAAARPSAAAITPGRLLRAGPVVLADGQDHLPRRHASRDRPIQFRREERRVRRRRPDLRRPAFGEPGRGRLPRRRPDGGHPEILLGVRHGPVQYRHHLLRHDHVQPGVRNYDCPGGIPAAVCCSADDECGTCLACSAGRLRPRRIGASPATAPRSSPASRICARYTRDRRLLRGGVQLRGRKLRRARQRLPLRCGGRRVLPHPPLPGMQCPRNLPQRLRGQLHDHSVRRVPSLLTAPPSEAIEWELSVAQI